MCKKKIKIKKHVHIQPTKFVVTNQRMKETSLPYENPYIVTDLVVGGRGGLKPPPL
jgi:hypothetical protein